MSHFSQHIKKYRRAFTLIEMLVTLSLLVVLMIVAISWVTSITKRQQRGVQEQGWYQAAYRVLDQIDRDLVAADMLHEARQAREPRVQIEDGQLLIRTVDHGAPSVVRYVLNPDTGTLHRLIESSQVDQFPILGSVGLSEFIIQLPDTAYTLPVLRITLHSATNEQVERSFLLMREDVQR